MSRSKQFTFALFAAFTSPMWGISLVVYAIMSRQRGVSFKRATANLVAAYVIILVVAPAIAILALTLGKV
jgi:hypothetical protein